MNLIDIYVEEVAKRLPEKIVKILFLSYGQQLRICCLMIIMKMMKKGS